MRQPLGQRMLTVRLTMQISVAIVSATFTTQVIVPSISDSPVICQAGLPQVGRKKEFKIRLKRKQVTQKENQLKLVNFLIPLQVANGKTAVSRTIVPGADRSGTQLISALLIPLHISNVYLHIYKVTYIFYKVTYIFTRSA